MCGLSSVLGLETIVTLFLSYSLSNLIAAKVMARNKSMQTCNFAEGSELSRVAMTTLMKCVLMVMYITKPTYKHHRECLASDTSVESIIGEYAVK